MPLKEKYIITVDQGTSSTRSIIFRSSDLSEIVSHSVPIKTITPHPGWAEQDPIELLQSVKSCLDECAKKAYISGIQRDDLAALGITNQRETTIAWDKQTGNPLGPALTWFDTRTQHLVDEAVNKTSNESDFPERAFQSKSGLLFSNYFCAFKIRWMLDNIPSIKYLLSIDSSRLAFGTVESWLLFMISKEKPHKTDITNASRTLLFNLESLTWDSELLSFFEIKREWLPIIHSNCEIFGTISFEQIPSLGDLLITGMIGDQHAALLGHGCLQPGQIKTTYGTGCFMLMNIGNTPLLSNHGLITTIAFQLSPDKPPLYAIEGSISMCGKYLDWIRDILGIESISALDNLASLVSDSSTVSILPTLSGTFAPYWCGKLKGSIHGLTLQSTRAHICRASIESICFQTQLLLECMQNDNPKSNSSSLSVDGGVTKSTLSMQLQANLSQKSIMRYKMSEFTSLGAAIAAGLGVGIWNDVDQVPYSIALSRERDIINPQDGNLLEKKYENWKRLMDNSVDIAKNEMD